MLSLTRKTDYALLALATLARRGQVTVNASELAQATGISARLLANVLNQLKHAGIVQTTRGTKGGYTLAKEADQITLTELVEAVEGPVRFALCCPVDDPSHKPGCQIEESCIIREPVRKLHANLRSFLGQVTLSDLAWNRVVLNVPVPAAGDKNGHAGGQGTRKLRVFSKEQ